MAKMSKKWIVLCSTALGAIYTAEYFATEIHASIQQAPGYSQVNILTESSPTPSSPTPSSPTPSSPAPSSTTPSSPVPSSKAPSSPVPSSPTPSSKTPSGPVPSSTTPSSKTASSPVPSSPTKSVYKEGTFTGTGSNRRGSIQVAVTIKKDKITDVEISDFAMHYSEDDVVGLPNEVLQKQSAQVDNVSGATYSTRAFEDAVQEALSQAQNS
ncbi:MAG: FMN-binding protein [Bacilli bacterium]|nr:FMN-binding protein [Bacilli bacterium]